MTQGFIDYRTLGWGHNLEIHPVREGVYEGFVFSGLERVIVGTLLVWQAEHGYVIAKVTKARPCMDPSDMYEISAKVVGREAEGSPLP